MTAQAHQQIPSSRHTSNVPTYIRRTGNVVLTLCAIVAFGVALFAATVLAYGLSNSDQIYPGVEIAGINVGGMSTESAQAQVDAHIADYLAGDLVFAHDGATFPVSRSEIGVQFDTSFAVEQAFAIGRGDSWWNDSREWIDARLNGRAVTVPVHVDETAIETHLRTIAPDITTPARIPTFAIADNGALVVTPSTFGTGIDVGRTLAAVRSEVSQFGNGPIQVVPAAVAPDYDEETLEPVYGEIAEILSEPLILEYSGYQWAIDVASLHRLIDAVVDPDTGDVTLHVDHDRLQRHLDEIAGDVRVEGRNASVFWDGESYRVREAVDGWTIDSTASLEIVSQAILNGTHSVELETQPVTAEVTSERAREAAEFGNRLAESRFELRWDDGTTDIAGSVIAAATTLELTDENELEPNVDVEKLTLFLTSISNDVEVRPRNADLRYINGEVIVAREESYGQAMDRQASAERIVEAVIDGELSAEIVVEAAEPDVTAAMTDEIVIREMLSFGETYYSGSAANRRHNVELATERANGTLVPPGGEYSFVDSIGAISLDNGYELGFGIIGTTDGSVSTVPSVGGGVCQVSTTVFQAAFWAGFPMVERNWHLYWMPLYGQPPSGMTGLDATVDTGAGLDFRFRNTTDEWIAIVSSANGSAVRFEIWGTEPGWDVDTSGPHISNRVSATQEVQVEESDRLPAGTRTQVETAHDGFDVLIERWVYDQSGDLIDELSLRSTYRPAFNRVLIGTG